MKMFLAAAVVLGVILVGTGFVYERVGLNATDVYSRDSARVSGEADVLNRPGFAPGI